MPTDLTPDAAVATHLAASGLLLVVGTNLFRGPVRPVSTGVPAKAAFVLATGGPGPVPFIDAAVNGDTYYFDVQVRIRGEREAFATTRTLARGVRNALHRASISGYLSALVTESEPAYLGPDDSERPEFSVNVRLIAVDAA
jgi:hypothetical protein